jgi:hypothetical protein
LWRVICVPTRSPSLGCTSLGCISLDRLNSKLLKSINAVMCHSSALWLCPAICSPHQLFLGEVKENQSAVQLDATFAGTMPPLDAARLASLNPGLQWNPFVILSVLCLLVIILVAATRKWKKTRQNGAFATKQRLKQDVKQDGQPQPQAKFGDAVCSDVSASQRVFYLPPPPGSILTTESRAGQIPLLYANSGTLAAQAMAKLWSDPSLTSEAEVRHPWRRHSAPLSKGISGNETNVFVTRDADQYFDDADLNGFWRRRTLEFA